VHVKEVRDEQVTELHLCEKCAREKGYHSMVEKNKLSLASQMVWMAENLYPEGSQRVGLVQCPECGLKYSEFLKTGRLGCPICYQTFDGQLKQVLRRVHGAVRHVGKAPGKEGEQFERRREIQKLHEELELAVEREEYEKAAELRDRIRSMEASGPDEEERPDPPGAAAGAGGGGGARRARRGRKQSGEA
jgi:protein arginine kinase activator